MEKKRNNRGIWYDSAMGKHLKLETLKELAKGRRYLSKENIPCYPRPEFRVSRLRHDTTPDGLRGIREDQAFKSPSGSLLWWSLDVGPEEVSCAEAKLLQERFPDLTPEQAQAQAPFLGKFATSPAFLETSRMGPFRFTFPLEVVLKAYSEQLCGGQLPVFRVFETQLFKQEVMYVIVVHSPANQELFSEYPLLPDDPHAVCRYHDGCFIWRTEAMCETHSYEMVVQPNETKIAVEDMIHEFYVWDNVSVALHIKDELLSFSPDLLRKNLTFCDEGSPTLGSFVNFSEAEELVQSLWPDDNSPLERAKKIN